MKLICTSILAFSSLCFEALSEQNHINVMHGVEMVKEGISLGYDINGLDSFGNTPLMDAAYWRRFEEAKVLISAGADVNYKSQSGSTALHKAATRGHLEIVRLLVQEGAHVDSLNKFKNTPIFLAAAHGRIEVVKILIEYSADLNRINIFGETILNRIRNDDTKLPRYKQIEKILIENGAMDINIHVEN